MRIGRTVNNDFALVNHLTVVNQNVLILRNKKFMILTLGVSNDQTLFALGFLTEGTVPLASARIPASFGERASKSSGNHAADRR